jgi:hypothetical protein
VNIAFTTLVILLLALPGYIARSAYLTENFTREVLPTNLTNEIALAILYSLPIHFVAVATITQLHQQGYLSANVNFEVVFRFLGGEYGRDGEEFSGLSSNLYEHMYRIATYFLCVMAAALLTGFLLRKIVWEYKLDVKIPTLFRYRNRWLYLLTAREQLDLDEPHITVVDALMELAHETQLYRGMVVGFISNEAGDLEDLYLGDVFRGKFFESATGETTFEWQEVPGDSFVLKYREIKNLNISFLPASAAGLHTLFAQAEMPASRESTS